MKKRLLAFLVNILVFYAVPAAGDSITVVAVGDIMMGTTYPENRLPPADGKYLYQGVEAALADADLTMGNLEGPLLEGGVCAKVVEKGRCYAFRTPTGFARNLVAAGFDFLNCANNHAADFGAGGVASTRNALQAAGLKSGGPDASMADFTVRGRSIAIMPFSVSSGLCPVTEIRRAQKLVAEQSRLHDIVIVSFHAGGEGTKFMHTVDTFEYYLGWPRGNVVKFSRAVIDSGADFVWGHGPHVPRALEIYRGRLIAYSLGNFCTWGFNLDDERGYAPILKVVFDSTGAFLSGRVISARQRTGQAPVLDPEGNAARLMKRLSEEDFPDSAPVIEDDGAIAPAGRE